MKFCSATLSSLVSASLAAAVPASPSPAASPLPPSQDPWYTAPGDLESAAPGEILRIRPAPGNLTTVYSNSSETYNILYRTTDSHDEPFWAVTTLFVPKEGNSSELLSYQVPYNSVEVDGSVSYLLYAPPEVNGLLYTDIQTALGKGWYVNVPDYLGPLTSFTAGVLEAHAVLDSIRAVHNADSDLASEAQIALWGYSGGSIGSEWAAEFHSAYAGELNIIGAAMGGTVSNLSSAIPQLPNTRWAGLLPEATLGMFSQYPEAMDYLMSQLHESGPYNASSFLRAQNLTIAEAFVYYAGQDVFRYFKSGAEFYNAPVVQNVLKRETYEGFHGIPQMPLFFYHAVHDEITNISNPQALVDRYCSVGVDLLFERNSIGEHLDEATNSDARALEWLEGVFAAGPEEKGCIVRDVARNATAPSAF